MDAIRFGAFNLLFLKCIIRTVKITYAAGKNSGPGSCLNLEVASLSTGFRVVFTVHLELFPFQSLRFEGPATLARSIARPVQSVHPATEFCGSKA